MTNARGHNFETRDSHIQALYMRHEAIEEKIEAGFKHPSVTDIEIKELKAQKLRLKDEIEEESRRRRA